MPGRLVCHSHAPRLRALIRSCRYNVTGPAAGEIDVYIAKCGQSQHPIRTKETTHQPVSKISRWQRAAAVAEWFSVAFFWQSMFDHSTSRIRLRRLDLAACEIFALALPAQFWPGSKKTLIFLSSLFHRDIPIMIVACRLFSASSLPSFFSNGYAGNLTNCVCCWSVCRRHNNPSKILPPTFN